MRMLSLFLYLLQLPMRMSLKVETKQFLLQYLDPKDFEEIAVQAGRLADCLTENKRYSWVGFVSSINQNNGGSLDVVIVPEQRPTVFHYLQRSSGSSSYETLNNTVAEINKTIRGFPAMGVILLTAGLRQDEINNHLSEAMRLRQRKYPRIEWGIDPIASTVFGSGKRALG